MLVSTRDADELSLCSQPDGVMGLRGALWMGRPRSLQREEQGVQAPEILGSCERADRLARERSGVCVLRSLR